MKKIFSLFVISLVLISLTACGSDYTSVIENVINFKKNHAAEDFNAAIGEKLLKYLVEEKYDSDMETYNIGLEKYIKYECEDKEISEYEIADVEEFERDSDGFVSYSYNDFIRDNKIDKVYRITVKYYATEDDVHESSFDFTVLKIDGEYCVKGYAEIVEQIINRYSKLVKNPNQPPNSSIYNGGAGNEDRVF